MSKNHKHDKRGASRTQSAIGADRIFYWAYGSNLCERQMARRCPRAVKWGPMSVADCALVFRSVADVTTREGCTTQGGLWTITAECERSLDAYEGVAGGMYMKRYFRIKVEGKDYTCLFYQMRTHKGVMPPSEDYLNTIIEGYRDFGLKLPDLDASVAEAWSSKDITEHLHDRHMRKGMPSLAKDVQSAQAAARFKRNGDVIVPSLKRLPPPMWREEGEHE